MYTSFLEVGGDRCLLKMLFFAKQCHLKSIYHYQLWYIAQFQTQRGRWTATSSILQTRMNLRRWSRSKSIISPVEFLVVYQNKSLLTKTSKTTTTFIWYYYYNNNNNHNNNHHNNNIHHQNNHHHNNHLVEVELPHSDWLSRNWGKVCVTYGCVC